MPRVHLHGWILSSAVILSACGGGGGDAETPPAVVPLSAANYQAVTTEVVDSVAGVGSLSDAVDLVTAANAKPAGLSPALTSGEPATLARYALSLTPRLQVSQRAQAQAVETYVEPCYTGSLTISANDADNNGVESSGDSVTITANNCVPQNSAPAINGSITLILGNVSYDRDGYLTSGTATISFNGFSSAGISLNGSARLSINSSAMALDFNRLVASDGARSRVYDYTLTVHSNGTASVDGPIEVGGSTYVLSTPVRVTFAGAYPSAGMVRFVDGHGSRVDVSLSSQSYAATLYLKGDEVADGNFSENW